ncbi:helix-turn-helix transcriptional regulator [Paenibacillus daejeonensis]|uniref:helix-turn-helix transcriptional regulator n=1 Tax=Paenibacillus daejeonensis TaxID=135193 RepID=UPI00035C540C|nr:helix-turn-helix transcriptional regulator [Paenibacillus daejeonensis]
MRRFRPLQAPVVQGTHTEPGYRYREYAPHPQLADMVACYWSLEVLRSSDQPVLHRILPDGCVDIIVSMNGLSSNLLAFTAGLMTHYRTMPLAEHSLTLGIRMYLDAVPQVTGYPVAAFGDGRVMLEELWNRAEASALMDELTVATLDAGVEPDRSPSPAFLIRQMETWLMRRVARQESKTSRGGATSQLVLSGMRIMYESRGMLPMRELAAQLGCSERTLRRVFNEELGLGPKGLSGVIRFQSVLRQLRRETRMTDAAYSHGLYDQPHLIHLFQRYYGMAPGAILSSPRTLRAEPEG